MRYIDATCGRINRHLEGNAALVVTRVAMPSELALPRGQAMEAQTEDTEVLLTA